MSCDSDDIKFVLALKYSVLLKYDSKSRTEESIGMFNFLSMPVITVKSETIIFF
jgi:hypothetical protein